MMKKDISKPQETYQNAAAANFYDSTSNTYVRSQGGRESYEAFRPAEIIPDCRTQQDQQKIMLMADAFYKRNGVVRSIVDLQVDLAIDGLSIHATEDSTQIFYDSWSKRADIFDRVEQFARWYLKSNNVVLQRKYGKFRGNKIPIRYFFYNPGNIELIGDFYGTMAEKLRYGIKIPSTSNGHKRTPTTEIEKQVYSTYPKEVRDAIENKTGNGNPTFIPLPENDVYVAYCKKDDTSIWAVPTLYSIFDDLLYNQKVKTAKITMLDGASCPTALWRLGDHKNQLMPSPVLGQKLAGITQANTNGGKREIIWDSAIDYQEFFPPIDKIAAFEERIEPILFGLGIQLYKDGSAENGKPIGLKDFISRIINCRIAIAKWLDSEFTIIRKATGFRNNPTVTFNNSNLFDEKIYWNIIRDLVDRNILSDDRMRELLKEDSSVERARIDEDEALRTKEEMPQKASPFHNPLLLMQQKHEIKKIQSENMAKEKQSGKSGGRPVGSRDKTPRVVRANTVNIVQASKIYDRVDKLVQSTLMESFGVKDARQLTNEQKKEIFDAKCLLYPTVNPELIDADDETIAACLDSFVPSISLSFAELFKQYSENSGISKLTNEELKIILVACYCESWNKL